MAKMRCKETTLDSFYGNFLYEQVIPKDHFLVKLKIDYFKMVAERLMKDYLMR